MKKKFQVSNFKFQVTLLYLVTYSFLLSACGFEPVYGTGGGVRNAAVENHLAAVAIGNIPDRDGQYLRNALIDHFYRAGRPQNALYDLSFSPLQESKINLDITKTADSTRGQLRLNTAIQLTERQTGEVVLSRAISATTSYNIIASEFATRVTEANARDNALDDLARQVELQLNLYFRR
jgi:LPS-assembly lipoprotein